MQMSTQLGKDTMGAALKVRTSRTVSPKSCVWRSSEATLNKQGTYLAGNQSAKKNPGPGKRREARPTRVCEARAKGPFEHVDKHGRAWAVRCRCEAVPWSRRLPRTTREEYIVLKKGSWRSPAKGRCEKRDAEAGRRHGEQDNEGAMSAALKTRTSPGVRMSRRAPLQSRRKEDGDEEGCGEPGRTNVVHFSGVFGSLARLDSNEGMY